jgi:hypothetical protein
MVKGGQNARRGSGIFWRVHCTLVKAKSRLTKPLKGPPCGTPGSPFGGGLWFRLLERMLRYSRARASPYAALPALVFSCLVGFAASQLGTACSRVGFALPVLPYSLCYSAQEVPGKHLFLGQSIAVIWAWVLTLMPGLCRPPTAQTRVLRFAAYIGRTHPGRETPW